MRTRRKSTIKEDLFEYDLDAYDMGSSLLIQNRSVLTEWKPYQSTKQHREMIPLGDLITTEDPLSPHLFINHHKRLEKEEKRAMEADRQRVVSGADKIFEQQNILQGPYWQREIANIVKIDNTHNLHELRTKRKLALEEIATFVDRFNKMERERKIKQRRYTEPTRRKPAKPLKRKSMHLPIPPAPPKPPKVWIYIPQRAFGVCMPELALKPQIFDIPTSWKRSPPSSPLPDEQDHHQEDDEVDS